MRKIKVTLTNSFHGTECVVLVPAGFAGEEDRAWDYLQEQAHASYYGGNNRNARAVVRRAKNTLCGSDDCTCGTVR